MPDHIIKLTPDWVLKVCIKLLYIIATIISR